MRQNELMALMLHKQNEAKFLMKSNTLIQKGIEKCVG